MGRPRVYAEAGRVVAVLAAVSLVSGCGADRVPSGRPVPGALSDQGAVSSSPPTEYEYIGDVLGYSTMEDVLDQASVTVEGEVTRRAGLDQDDEDPHASWVMWELKVTDSHGADVPATLTVVDAARPTTSVKGAGVPFLTHGMDGVFALHSHDTDTVLIHPEFGRTYFAVAVLERTDDGFTDVTGRLEPFPSLDGYAEMIEDDNGHLLD